MAYARMGPDSDVYVYGSAQPWGMVCCGCLVLLADTNRAGKEPVRQSFVCETGAEMLEHLEREHILLYDHKVEDRVLRRLREEIKTGLV